MAVCFIMDFDGGGADEYDATLADMELGGEIPTGGLFHGAGETETGWRVVDVWETAEQFEAFAQEKIGPLSAKNGFSEPRIESFEVAQTRVGDDEPVTFLAVTKLPGVDADRFAALNAAVMPDDELPEGVVYHVNGPLDDGWCVVGYWASKELRDAFMTDVLAPAMQQAGAGTPPQIEDLPLHNSMHAASVTT